MYGLGHLRASRADREQVIDVLKVAFVQERLDKEELDDRVAQALAARTYADLGALIADLPALPGKRPVRPVLPQRMRLRDRQGVQAVGAAGAALVAIMTTFAAGAVFGTGGFLIMIAVNAVLAVLLTIAAVKLDSRQRHRRLPPGAGEADPSTCRPCKPRQRPDDGLALALLSSLALAAFLVP